MHSSTHSYKDLIVWQRAVELAVALYKVTSHFPSEERFGLISQMRRAAVSIASNIAEGRQRSTKKDFVSFLYIAYSSGAELETQIMIAKRLPKTQDCDFSVVDDLLLQTLKMLNKMISTLKASS